MPPVKGLRERLKDGDSVICAEGYMREFERRGFVRIGTNTPEIVLEHPHQVRLLHEEYVRAGSDVVEAFTYYGHRHKLRQVGLEDKLETLNMAALHMARDVADVTGTLMAGNICNTTTFDPSRAESYDETRAMFKEQIEWAVQAGADYIIGETFNDFAEAKIALESIQAYGQGLPAVITITIYFPERTTDDVPVLEALQRLEAMGADVVGLNCARGPDTMLPLLEKARKVCKGPLAALPVPFRTTDKERTFQSLTDLLSGERCHPLDSYTRLCNRSDIRRFAQKSRDIGIQYIGLCCGTSSAFIREVAQVYGRHLQT